MVSLVKQTDFRDGIFHIVDDGKEGEIFGVDQAPLQQLLGDKRVPVVPIVAPRSLEAHDRFRVALAGLHKGENLKSFIVGAESPGEQRDRVGFFLKHELAREEVLEGDEFGVIGNDGVGALARRAA